MFSRLLQKRGQLFSIDGVISIIAFFLILIFFVFLWNDFGDHFYSQSQAEIVFEEGNYMMQALLTQSDPPGWMAFPGVMDYYKVQSFFNQPYSQTKILFNLERYDYKLDVVDLLGNITYTLGSEPLNNSSPIVINRLVIINNETKSVRLTIWKP